MAKVSVIVPVYNAEKYLKRMVDSLRNQEEKDIEIILINDGSTDKSYELMKEFANKDNRISIYTQENKGVASTRNRGISLAKGEYIYFADADDFVYKEAISTLLYYAKKYNVNYVRMAHIRDISNSNGKILSGKIYSDVTLVSKEDYRQKVFDIFLKTYQLNQLWSCIIKKSILTENSILFDDGSFFAEDFVFSLRVFMHLESALFIPDAYYYYINNPNSITTKVDFESLKRKVNEAAKNYSYLFTFFQHFEMNKEKEINKRVTKEVVCCIKPIYSLTAKCSKKQRIELIKYAKETLSKYNIKNKLLKNNYILDFGYLIVYRYIYALKPIVKKILFK